ncbi:hypothetical protein SAMN05660477_03105 [Soonwooa buanensis]|uniref:Uncharacterized protein n=1 Tax=Soonwooa buanensis TaxID=619805 RepID=A0A1T5GSQ0_9FLAO|nr:hypothetical protein [Soonwooa buanensis]SKC11421.1 hypothetical protein SAMN05660477_03105 [Soonwooa buanensis]
MYQFYNNILTVPARALYEDLDVMSKSNYDKLCRLGKIDRVRQGKGLDNHALVDFESLPERFRVDVVKKLGYPPRKTVQNLILNYFKDDYEAVDFYASYKLDDFTSLKPEKQDEYVKNAQMLWALDAYIKDMKSFRKARGGSITKIWQDAAQACKEVKDYVGHTLPGTDRRLREKLSEFLEQGYIVLVSEKFGNKNSVAVKDNQQEAVLRELFRKWQGFDNVQIADQYNPVAKALGWATLSPNSVGNYRKKWSTNTISFSKGIKEFDNKIKMQIKRKAPEYAMAYWTLSDGIIDAAEAIAIEKYINQINTEQSDLSQKYQIIYNDVNLTGSSKTELATAWGTSVASGTGYLGAHKKLINSIFTAIADGKTTETEKLDVDTKFTNYKEQLSILTAKFQNAITSIGNERINAIQVGGRNLLRNTNFEKNINHWVSNGVAGVTISWNAQEKAIFIDNNNTNGAFMQFVQLEKGQYILSFMVKPTYQAGGNYNVSISSPNSDNPYVSIHTNNEWKKYIIILNLTGVSNYLAILPNASQKLLFKNIKLEKGNKATDWTPAVEDIEDNISDAQNTANNAISILTDIGSDNKLTASEKQTTLNEWNRIKSEYTSNYTLAASLLLSVTSYQSAYNSLNNYLSPLLTDLTSTSNINGDIFRNIFKNYYDQNIAIVILIGKTQINNLQIGGRNLLKNSDFKNDIKEWHALGLGEIIEWKSNNNGCIFLNNNANRGGFYQSFEFVSEIYTVSFEVMPLFQNGSIPYSLVISIAGISKKIDIHYSNDWKKYSLTIDDSGLNVNKIFALQALGEQQLLFKNIKLEKGNKATDWTPAPEDVDEQINAANQQSANAIAQAQNAMNTAALANQVTSFLSTSVNQNVVATGTLLVGDVNGANAMISGVTDQPNGESIRFAAGKPYDQKYLSPFQVLDNGMIRFVNPLTGQKTFELGFNQNTGKVAFDIYNDNGIKIASIGSQGIMFTGYIPESYTKRNFRKLNTTSFTQSEISAELVAGIMQKFHTGNYPPTGPATDTTQFMYDIGLNVNMLTYEYYEGRNFESADNSQYSGFYTSKNKFGDKIPNGIYLKQFVMGGYTQMSTNHYNINYWCEAYLIQDGRIVSSMEIFKTINISSIPTRGTAFPPEDYEQ